MADLPRIASDLDHSMLDAGRLLGLPRAVVMGMEVPVAVGWRARLIGLAALDRRRAGAGLLIPRCRSIHTFGMRFAIDVVFLDAAGGKLERHDAVGPRRILGCRAADAVLELVPGLEEHLGGGGRPNRLSGG